MHFVDIPLIANKSPKYMLHNNSPIMLPPHTHQRSVFIGLLILYKIINPTIDKSIVHAVDISVSFTSNTCPNTTSAPTTNTSVIPAGSAFIKTFVRKLPCIMFLFGCNAKKNAGIPIVNILISET